jgi:hypothetical protein
MRVIDTGAWKKAMTLPSIYLLIVMHLGHPSKNPVCSLKESFEIKGKCK